MDNAPALPRIFYDCSGDDIRLGGPKHTYRHVDILNANGMEAYVVHDTEGQRLQWFANKTRVISRQRFNVMFDERRDYVVLPESLGSAILDYPGRKIIFNKCIYFGFTLIGDRFKTRDPYIDPCLHAVFSVSEHNATHLRFAYPTLRVFHLLSSVDTSRFAFRPLHKKKPQIVCMGKAQAQVGTLFQMLRARTEAGLNNLKAFSWVTPTTLYEDEMALLLQDSLIFIFLNVEEGLPFAVLEALACGCLVIAYSHGPLPECLPPGAGFSHGDLIGVASRIEQIAATFPDRIHAWKPLSEAGRAISDTYSVKREVASVLNAWKVILNSHAASKAPASAI